MFDFIKRFIFHRDYHKLLRVYWTMNEMLMTDFLAYVENDKRLSELDKETRYRAVIAAKNALEELIRRI